MNFVATLIANLQTAELTDALLARAAGSLPASGTPLWLAEKSAADIPFSDAVGADTSAHADQLRGRLNGAAVDVVVQPAQGRRKKLLVADMDSTVIGQECIDELADFAGLKAHISAITERAMRGEIEFEPALRERVALLKGLPVSVVDEVLKKRITLTPGARTLVATMRRNGAYTCLVSGGFTLFTRRIASMIGFDEDRSNILRIGADNNLAGGVNEPILGRAAKLQTLQELTQRLDLAPDETLAIGDGANDLSMLEAAGLGVAYHAKPKVAAAAHARIDHNDLTALLYIQGYRREEFAEAE